MSLEEELRYKDSNPGVCMNRGRTMSEDTVRKLSSEDKEKV